MRALLRPLHDHAAIRAAPFGINRQYRPGPQALRHAFAAANKGNLDLSRTGNLRAVQLLLGHTKIESTVIGIEVDDALAIAEQVDV